MKNRKIKATTHERKLGKSKRARTSKVGGFTI